MSVYQIFSDELLPRFNKCGAAKEVIRAAGGSPAFHKLCMIININTHGQFPSCKVSSREAPLCWIDTILGPHTDLLINDKFIKLAKLTGC